MVGLAKPRIVMFGGVHDDPGCRMQLVRECEKRKSTPPLMVCAEWDKSVFVAAKGWRPEVAKRAREQWSFLSSGDADQLAAGLAFEGDAHEAVFGTLPVVWLEEGYQPEHLKRVMLADVPMAAKSFASGIASRICDPCGRIEESLAGVTPKPDPTSAEEIVRLLEAKAWAGAGWYKSPDNERDKRWFKLIEQATKDNSGWVAVVVGWGHADPERKNGLLRDLLVDAGYAVESVKLRYA